MERRKILKCTGMSSIREARTAGQWRHEPHLLVYEAGFATGSIWKFSLFMKCLGGMIRMKPIIRMWIPNKNSEFVFIKTRVCLVFRKRTGLKFQQSDFLFKINSISWFMQSEYPLLPSSPMLPMLPIHSEEDLVFFSILCTSLYVSLRVLFVV